jgi:hypothetical protein
MEQQSVGSRGDRRHGCPARGWREQLAPGTAFCASEKSPAFTNLRDAAFMPAAARPHCILRGICECWRFSDRFFGGAERLLRKPVTPRDVSKKHASYHERQPRPNTWPKSENGVCEAAGAACGCPDGDSPAAGVQAHSTTTQSSTLWAGAMMMMPFICSFRNKNEPTAIYPPSGYYPAVAQSRDANP